MGAQDAFNPADPAADDGPARFDTLVQPERVHRSVYTDPAIFALEMRRIFGHAWVYVGHESQVPEPGDYFTTLIGSESVILIRDQDGAVNVLYNRCPHKGARILPDGSGNTGRFMRCLYHAWSFRCDGRLISMPLRQGYEGTPVTATDPEYSMRKVARVASHRGFVFASLAADGPDLKTYLGGIAESLDNFCDRAPAGRVEVAGGVQRVIQRSNWKVFFENLHDTMHPVSTHESSWASAKAQYKTLPEGTPMPFVLHIVDGNGEPYEFFGKLDMKGYDFGHGYMEGIFTPPKDPVSLEYVESLKAAYGEERTQQILSINRHNSIVYPSCSPHTSFQQLRVIRPLTVDRTLVEIFTFRLVGAPQSTFRRALTYTNVVNSPASLVMPDDVEAYNRVQRGLQTTGSDWVSMHRGLGHDRPFTGGLAASGNSEMPQRNQFRAWSYWMNRDWQRAGSGTHEAQDRSEGEDR